MKTSDQNRINMLAAILAVLNQPEYKALWEEHEAFTEGVDGLTSKVGQIEQQAELAQGNPGAADAKELARRALCKAVCEVIGGVRSFANANADAELAAKANYTPSTVTVGKVTEVVARCRVIATAASDNLEALGKYGITQAKLTGLNKKIDAFDKLKTAPRQNQSLKSAVSKILPQLVREGVAIVRDQLDELMPQFQDANPNFYNEYFAARVVVDQRGSHAEKPQPNVVTDPTVAPTATPQVKKVA
ncbi:MAG: hypothetical protein HY043_01160 [Verrucomicrobia bacterium]|nr:hypothetical protein [Verrucomicrobiota bacterium]